MATCSRFGSRLHTTVATLAVVSALLAACGGGGGSTSTEPGASGTPAPSPAPSPAPTPTPEPTPTPAPEPTPAPSPAPDPAPISQGRYDVGNPTVTTIFVAPTGSDGNDGASAATPLRTLLAAWQRVPTGNLSGTGYRILLAPGTYAAADIPHYMDGRSGSRNFPIIIEAAQRGTVTLQRDLNVFGVSYLYIRNLVIRPVPAGDAFHCEQCDHLLLSGNTINGGNSREAQEALKINQSQYVYLEDNDISGAWDNAIDYVAVQYGHVVGNTVHNSGDWCQYAKGGSAYLRIEGNTYFNCGTGGFTAGQGTGFQFMTSPWIHYEAYGIRFVNNVVHDVEGAAIGANGAFNVLFAHNTFYRVGTRSHLFEAVAGMRSCDGRPGEAGRERCQQYLDAGGWGTTVVDDGTNAVLIPNRNVLVLNNIFYNPAGVQSQWQHFRVVGAIVAPAGSNVPADARGDTGLVIRGNWVWDGPAGHPLLEDATGGCPDSNATCNPAQLVAQNSINQAQPQLVNPAAGDYRLVAGGNVDGYAPAAIPDFSWSQLPARPAAPAGDSDNRVTSNMPGQSRATVNRIGAF